MSNTEILKILKKGNVRWISKGMDFFAFDTEYNKVVHLMPMDTDAYLWTKQFMTDEEFLTKDLTNYTQIFNY